MEENEKRLIKELWENGEPAYRIAKLFPYKKSEICDYIKKMRSEGVFDFSKHKKNKKTTEAMVLALYNGGETNPYIIADKMGRAVNSIRKILVDAKLKRERPKHNYKERKKCEFEMLCEKTKKIIIAIKKGEPFSKISRDYGVSRQWVYSIKDTHLLGKKRNKHVYEVKSDGKTM